MASAGWELCPRPNAALIDTALRVALLTQIKLASGKGLASVGVHPNLCCALGLANAPLTAPYPSARTRLTVRADTIRPTRRHATGSRAEQGGSRRRGFRVRDRHHRI